MIINFAYCQSQKEVRTVRYLFSSATNYFTQIVYCCCSCFGREITAAPFENEHTFEQKGSVWDQVDSSPWPNFCFPNAQEEMSRGHFHGH